MDLENVDCEDPQFLEVFEACLQMEIATARETLSRRKDQVKKTKQNVYKELSKRKELKAKVKQMEEWITKMNVILKKLEQQLNETTDKIELIKANADDKSKLMLLELEKQKSILKEYRQTWESYQAQCEELPLAKVRREEKIKLEKVRIEEMVVEYKINELKKVLKQRKWIAWIRERGMIIEFARVMLKNSGLRSKLTFLNRDIDCRRKELCHYEQELAKKRREEAEKQRTRELIILEMPPPKIRLPMMLVHPRSLDIHERWKQDYRNCLDTISVNTETFERMCINEEDSIQTCKDVEEEVQRDEVRTPENMPERSDTVASPEKEYAIVKNQMSSMGAEASNEMRKDASPVENVQISIVNRSVSGAREESSLYIDINSKKKSDEENRSKNASQKSTDSSNTNVKRKVDSGAVCSTPKVRRIETVHYDIPSTSRLSVSLNPASMFSPRHYECCDSNFTNLERELCTQKDDSIREGSPCNYEFPDCFNISPVVNIDEDAAMESVVDGKRSTWQNKDPSQSDPPQFDFLKFLKKKSADDKLF